MKTSACAQHLFIQICRALISGINTKTESQVQGVGGGGRRDEGTRGQKTVGLGGRALSAARSHDNTPEKKETTEAATILTVPLQTLR